MENQVQEAYRTPNTQNYNRPTARKNYNENT